MIEVLDLREVNISVGVNLMYNTIRISAELFH